MAKNDKKIDQKLEVAPVKPYKYMCPACTNAAFLSAEPKVGVKFTCPSCLKEQVTESKNYIKL